MYRLIIDCRINSVAQGNYIYPLLWRYKLGIRKEKSNKMQQCINIFIIPYL